jgi:hypothetical protein
METPDRAADPLSSDTLEISFEGGQLLRFNDERDAYESIVIKTPVSDLII